MISDVGICVETEPWLSKIHLHSKNRDMGFGKKVPISARLWKQSSNFISYMHPLSYSFEFKLFARQCEQCIG